MLIFNQLLDFWVNTHWLKALIISTAVNITIYFITASLIYKLAQYANTKKGLTEYIDKRNLKPNQVQEEIKNGFIACLIFAVGSLITRELFIGKWPESIKEFFLELLIFSVYYEMYSYAVHRLLHTKKFTFIHKVHHKSVTVTPYSAYSVHFIEAMFIGFSAPFFMMFFDISLGVVFILHVVGMIYTIFIHSNMQSEKKAINRIFSISRYHSVHHIEGNKNFGFVNIGLDKLFGTKY